VPTVAQSGVPGYSAPLGLMVVGQKNLPPEVIAKWEKDVQQIMKTDDARTAFEGEGAEPDYVSHNDLLKLFASESGKWEKIVREAGIAEK
jgi:tripartite-type tricarboxylate transporter receptor subunit TctC